MLTSCCIFCIFIIFQFKIVSNSPSDSFFDFLVLSKLSFGFSEFAISESFYYWFQSYSVAEFLVYLYLALKNLLVDLSYGLLRIRQHG